MGKLIKEYEVAPRQYSDLEPCDKVNEIAEKLTLAPDNDQLWMEKGLAYASQSLYREAEECYSRAIALNPFCGIYYRHRGHRMLSCYRFEDGCADFVMASRLIPKNWDVWYHLGLSYFLLGDYAKAEDAYSRCYALSKKEEDLIAVTDWYWMTLQREGKADKAAEILASIREDFDPGENVAYFNRLLMYKGLVKPESLLPTDGSASMLDIITMGFGLSNYYNHIGDRKKSDEVIDMVLQAGDKDCYFAFGYLAAMVDKENRAKESK